jgi:hypothetical protein
VYASTNGADFVLWQSATRESQAIFTGELGQTYWFACRARDGVGNTEAAPLAPQAHKVCAVTQGSKALVQSVPPAQLAEAVPQALKAFAETRVLKARRSLVLPAPLAEVVPQASKAWPEIPVPEAPPWPVLLVQPDLPVMQARKAQPVRQAHKAPQV